jgi:hypothetical protein
MSLRGGSATNMKFTVLIFVVSSGGASYKAHLGYAGLSIKHITSETVV